MTIEGLVEQGWEPVADVFRASFEEGLEVGAAVAVYAGGQPVVDLWGGVADSRTGRPWTKDTAVLVFSTTKGATAICAHMLVERGLLDLDAPVATYWPEFAQAGKEEIPVRWLLTHQAGLAAPDVDITFEELCAGEPVLRALEAQAPLWEPGTAFAYHALTYGHLVGEVVRRVSRRPLGRFFAEEVAGPLGLHSWIGLPDGDAVDRAWIVNDQRPNPDAEPVDPSVVALWVALAGPGTVFQRSMTLGAALPAGLVTPAGERDFNDPALLAVDLGASNLVTDARSVARMYAAVVGEVDGVRLLSEDTVRAASELQTVDVPYFGTPEELRSLPKIMDFAVGFLALPGRLSSVGQIVGHGGAGGSLGAGDLGAGIGFGYVMNRMAPDQRAARLADAVRACVDAHA